MRLVSVRELKATPSEFLRLAAKGETVVIASRGKPAAILRAISEEELEDYVLENSPKIKRLVAEGERDRRAGRRVRQAELDGDVAGVFPGTIVWISAGEGRFLRSTPSS